MLQDLWLPPQAVVAGDHVVHEGRFYKVLSSEKIWGNDWKAWELTLEVPDGEFSVELPHMDVENRPTKLRVRPCGPSHQVEET